MTGDDRTSPVCTYTYILYISPGQERPVRNPTLAWLNANGEPGASGAGSMRSPAALQLRGLPSGTLRRALRARPAARRASQVLNWQGALGLLIRAGCMSFSGMRRGAVSASHDVHPYQVRGLRTLPPCSRLPTLPTSHPSLPDVLSGALTALQSRRNLRPLPPCPFYRPPSFRCRLLTAQMA